MPTKKPASPKRPAAVPAPLQAEPPLPASRSRRLATVVLLLVGGLIWVGLGPGHGIGAARWIIILTCGALALVPTGVGTLLERLRTPPRNLAASAALVAIAAACYLALTAFLQDRDLFPKTHDDCSYAIGMQMLARGRLWMPALPLGDFFDSFYILVKPVYCSIYLPGTALIFTPTVWLKLPMWVMPTIVSGLAVMMLYLVITELIDHAAGLLAALLLVSLTWFRTYSVLLTSQSPMLLLGLLIVWTWLRWRSRRRWYWSLALGVAAGWSAITRPVDAVCFALPVAIGLSFDLGRRGLRRAEGQSNAKDENEDENEDAAHLKRAASSFPFHANDSARSEPRPPMPRRVVVTIATIILGALPFIVLQATFNKGVTGSPLRLPYTYYLEQDQPGSTFGFRTVDPNRRPPSPLPQKQAYYDWCKSYLLRHQPGNFLGPWLHATDLGNGQTRPAYLSMIADTTMPARLLLPLAAIGVLGLTDRRRVVLAATLPLFIVLYLFNPFFLEHYAIAVIPAVVLLVLLGVRALARARPRFAPSLASAVVVIIVVASLTSLWEIDRFIPGPKVDDETFHSAVLRTINVDYPAALEQPAVVLFRYHPGDDFFREPVYNWDVAWPDDAPVIRAHDLGADRDREIIEYYARHQPRRTFYLFDAKASEPMVVLGRAEHPEAVANLLREYEAARP